MLLEMVASRAICIVRTHATLPHVELSLRTDRLLTSSQLRLVFSIMESQARTTSPSASYLRKCDCVASALMRDECIDLSFTGNLRCNGQRVDRARALFQGQRTPSWRWRRMGRLCTSTPEMCTTHLARPVSTDV